MISIIMPTYNRADVLKRSIISVLRQSYSEYELIIVDDGSLDKTKKIVESFNEEKIKYIKLEHNSGANYARNIGMKASKGELIAFLDSDNEWDEDYLFEQYKVFTDEDVDISFFKMKRIYPDGHARVFPELTERIDNETIFNKMLVGNIMDTNVTCIRRMCYIKYGGFDEHLPRFQDWDLFMGYLEKGAKAVFNNSVKARCYTLSDSISLRNDFREKAFSIILVKHYLYMQQQKCLDDFIISMLSLVGEQISTDLFDVLKEIITNHTLLGKMNKIILYGYGNNGKKLYKLLKKLDIISAVVDKYCEIPYELDVPFYRNVQDNDRADCILVSIKDGRMDIVNELIAKTSIPVYNTSDVFNA